MNFRKYLKEQFHTLELYATYGPPDSVPGGPDHDDYFIACQVADIVADVRRVACRFMVDPGPCSDDTHAAMAYVGRLLEQSKPAGDLLTVKQAADQLNVSQRTVYDLCDKGRLRCQRIGIGRGTIRICPSDLEGCLAEPEPVVYKHLTL